VHDPAVVTPVNGQQGRPGGDPPGCLTITGATGTVESLAVPEHRLVVFLPTAHVRRDERCEVGQRGVDATALSADLCRDMVGSHVVPQQRG
jgi:hypothetical protein